MLNASTVIDFFGALSCYSCGSPITEVALSLSGDEEHIYCRECWTAMAKQVERRKKSEEANSEWQMKTSTDG